MKKLLEVLQLPSPLQKVDFPDWGNYGVEVYFKRDDLIHPAVSGNKWRKLYGHLKEYFQGDYQGILTYGGAFSNHIVAVATACNYLEIPVYGVIRGETDKENPTLKYAQEQGMILLPLSRSAYRNKDIAELAEKYQEIDFSALLQIPEGGAGKAGIEGCAEIIREISLPYDFIVSAAGTGTTVAGLAEYAEDSVKVLGISVLKGADTLTDAVQELTDKKNFEIITGYHFGGYARYTKELLEFAREFTAQTTVPLDFVYTAKMVFGFDDLLRKGYFKRRSKIVLLHTGGLMNAGIDTV